MNIPGRGELRSPAGDRRSPLRVRMLILKNIKFVSFSAGASPRPTKFVRILGEGTYFVGVGALDDPKNNQLLQHTRRA